jgi:hypothetical protein
MKNTFTKPNSINIYQPKNVLFYNNSKKKQKEQYQKTQ